MDNENLTFTAHTQAYTAEPVDISLSERRAFLAAVRGRVFAVTDLPSLLGTTADAAHVLVLFACADAVALASATDFAGYKAARMAALADLSGGDEGAAAMVQQAGKLLTDVKSGEVIMPFLVKPNKATGVFADVAERATGVAKALMQPATQE